MAAARPVLPTDILALVTYNGRSYPNQAWTRERLGTAAPPALPLAVALDQCLAFARGRSAWISVRRQRLQGLVGARQRGGRPAWEIDYLIEATGRQEGLGSLLECAVTDVGRSGSEKLFLRLTAGSALLPVVLEAGFMVYQEEALYARVGLASGPHGVALRRMTPSDSYLAYLLYNAATPETVRRSEAATFREWHAAQERRWLRDGVQLVSEHAGRADAVVRAARLSQGVVLDVLAGTEAAANAEDLIRSGLAAVEGDHLPVFVLAPKFSAIVSPLERAGFDLQGEYVSLVRRTTRPVTLRKLVPSIAKTAVGV